MGGKREGKRKREGMGGEEEEGGEEAQVQGQVEPGGEERMLSVRRTGSGLRSSSLPEMLRCRFIIFYIYKINTKINLCGPNNVVVLSSGKITTINH